MSNRFNAALLCVVASSGAAAGQLTLLPSGPQLGTHVGNLVTNGSFETGGPAPGILHWATGTSLTPFGVPTGWTSSGAALTYANWGGSAASGPSSVATSVTLPDGQNGMYFGNGAPNFVSQPPTYLATREVTFPSTPSFSMAHGQACVLTQTVPTHLNLAPSYLLSFWVTGEGSGLGPGNPIGDGFFGLRVSNTAAGNPMRYFQIPVGSASPLGASVRYEFSMVPLNPLLPITIEFTNWGHMDLTAYGRSGTTEIVLDDVIVNAVPGPGSAAVLGVGILALNRRRRGTAGQKSTNFFGS